MSTTPTAPRSLPLVDDPRPAYAQCVDVARSVLEQVRPEHADLTTPADMTVVELLVHLDMAVQRTACAGRGVPIDEWPEGSDPVPVPEGVRRLDESLDDAIDAWADDATLTAPRPLPWDPTTVGYETLALYLTELLLHTWDLAQAIGASPEWTDDVVTAGLALMLKQLPVAERGPMWERFAAELGVDPSQVTPYADAVPVPADASLTDQLLGWAGRQPGSAC